MEAEILSRIRSRVESFLDDGGEELLREMIAAGLKSNERDPEAEIQVLEQKIKDIDEKTDRLVDRLADNLNPQTKKLVEKRLVALTEEKEVMERQIEELELLSKQTIDPQVLVDDAIACIRAFEEVFSEGTLLERKEFVRLFVERIELDVEEKRALLHIKRFPAPSSLDTGNRLLVLVAGARYEQEKKLFPPIDLVEMPLDSRGTTLIPMAA